MLRECPNPSEAQIRETISGNLCRCTGYANIVTAALAAARLAAALTAMTRAVGRSVRRKEDRRLLTGRGKYAADFRLPGLLHGAVLRSPHAHARLGEIRAKAALALPGVVAVVTAEDLGDVGRIPTRLGHRVGNVACLQRPLARDKVRYVGEPVAFVVAESRYLAEDALDADRGRLRPAAGRRRRAARHGDAARRCSTTVVGGNVVETLSTRKGDAAAAMASAHVRVRERFAVQRHTGVPMETRGLTAAFDPGTGVLRLWGVAKVPHFNRRVLADLLGHPEHLIQFIELEVGGGFGVRGEFYPGGLPGAVGGDAARPAGAVDRGPPRAPDGDQPLAPAVTTTSRSASIATAGSSPSWTTSWSTWARTSARTASSCPS